VSFCHACKDNKKHFNRQGRKGTQSKTMQETSNFNVSVFNLKEILTFLAFFAALRDQVF